jgi:hypothetical protein
MDVFGLDKGAQNRKILTSHDPNTTIKFGSSSVALLQQASLQYQQRADPRFAVGGDAIYWSIGQSQGTMQCNKMVAEESSVWQGFDGLQNGRDTARVRFSMSTANGGVSGDGVWQSVSLGMTVGDMSITDNAVLRVAAVNPT